MVFFVHLLPSFVPKCSICFYSERRKSIISGASLRTHRAVFCKCVKLTHLPDLTQNYPSPAAVRLVRLMGGQPSQELPPENPHSEIESKAIDAYAASGCCLRVSKCKTTHNSKGCKNTRIYSNIFVFMYELWYIYIYTLYTLCVCVCMYIYITYIYIYNIYTTCILRVQTCTAHIL